ncbi:hypothetical protein M8J77_013180 [Diaphorina citri]|nr:hypothetical protein M8J77_013180 [Diaphorina citri]
MSIGPDYESPHACELCEVSFMDINENYEDIVRFFIQHNILKNKIQCEQCLNMIQLNQRDLVFRCSGVDKVSQKKCYFFKSAKKNTILEHSTIRIKPFFNFVAVLLFLKPPRNKIYREHLKLNNATFSIWSKLCRDILIRWNDHHFKKIGGKGYTVEVDISNICGGSSLILGGICRETKEIFLHPIEKKFSSMSVTKIVEDNVEPDSCVITKQLEIYECLKQIQTYTHFSVKKLVDESTGAHINHIQRLWRDVKINIPHHSFKNEQMLLPYLAEYKFKKSYPDLERMHYFFKSASGCY